MKVTPDAISYAGNGVRQRHGLTTLPMKLNEPYFRTDQLALASLSSSASFSYELILVRKELVLGHMKRKNNKEKLEIRQHSFCQYLAT